jgi:diacylglycerol kinase
MMTVAFATRMLLSPAASIAVFITIVLFFTLLSGLQYAVNGWREITRKSLRLQPRQWYLLLFYSLVLPAILVGTLHYTKLMTWAVIVTFAIEFAGRGLDNHVTYCGKELHRPSELAKSALQMLAGATALFAGFYEFHGHHVLFASALTAVVAVTCVYNSLIFYRNRGLLH